MGCSWVLRFVCAFVGCLIGVRGQTCDTFGFASYYGSNMVLQEAPARPRIWGYWPDGTDTVTVEIVGVETVTATTGTSKSDFKFPSKTSLVGLPWPSLQTV